MHAKPDLRVVLKCMIAGSGSVIADVIRLDIMSNSQPAPKDSIEEYTWLCNSLFGTYMDGIWGFNLVGKSAQDALQQETPNGKPPLMSFIPKKYDPATPTKVSDQEMAQRNVHRERADKIADRNSLDGPNSLFLAQMTLITVFHYWEDKYRAMIASEFGLASKGDLKVDGVGDIRLLRISIVHHKGIAKKEIERTKRFQWFKENDHILLDFDKMLAIKNYIMNDFRDECLQSIESSKQSVAE